MPNLLGFLKKRREDRAPFCSVIVPAAGNATRMEGMDKILLPLADEIPVLIHALRPFEESPLVDEIIVVTREDLIVPVAEICKAWGITKLSAVVLGGKTRTESVQAGMHYLDQRTQLVAVHDGARPFLSASVLQQVLLCAAKTGAAAPAVAVVDTIKTAQNDIVQQTLDRQSLRAIQTPQVFERGLFTAALQKAITEQVFPSDDCALVERLGMQVSLVAGQRENIKVTTPFDLAVANAIIMMEGLS